jgi:NmrA-like family
MTAKSLAVVLGATRGQGASVINALLKTGQYTIRGLTIDASLPAAEDLRKRGVEVIEVDLDNPEAVKSAFTSALVIFAVTTMYAGDVEREVQQGINIANAAASTDTLAHYIWSTLPSASTVSEGKISVPHMDGKARVDEYILSQLPHLASRTTFYWGGFYAENVTYPNNLPTRLETAGQSHVWVQAVTAGTEIPLVGDHTVNTGLFVRQILAKADLCLPGKYVLGVVDWIDNGELLKLWLPYLEKHGKGLDPIYVRTDLEAVARLWPGTGKELGGMLKLSEELGRKAWSKKDVIPLTFRDLGLSVGGGDDELVGTERAIKKLGSRV